MTDAIYRMGQVHMEGLLGATSDPWQGYQCFAKAAEEGHPEAMLALSKAFADGIQGYLEPKPELAFRWCQRAAERGGCVGAAAEYMLGYV